MSSSDEPDVSVEKSGAALGAASSLAAVAFGSAYLLGEKLANSSDQGMLSGTSFAFFTFFTFIISVAAFLSGLAFLANVIVFVWPATDAVWGLYSQKLLKAAAYVTFVWGGIWGFTLVLVTGAFRLLLLFHPPDGQEVSFLWQAIALGVQLAAFSLGLFTLTAFPVHDVDHLMSFEITKEFGLLRGVIILVLCCVGASLFVLSCFRLDVSLSPSIVGSETDMVEISIRYSGMVFGDDVTPRITIRPANGDLQASSISAPALVEMERGSYIGWLNTRSLASGAYVVELSLESSVPVSWERWPDWIGGFLLRRLDSKRLAFFVEAGNRQGET